jgi:excinuclease ABC subunit C
MSPRRFAEETEHAAVSARSVVAHLPNAPGVYRFRDASERVLYIGRAINLRRRVGSYWTQPDGRLAEMVRRIGRIEAVICQSEHEAAWLERNLLEQSLPPWNKTAGGQEVPVFLRLDWQSGSPGVTVVHSIEPSTCVRHFGPYLGGGKVRLAAAALHRVMPLAYTGELLHQSEQDMARVRGIDPNARLALVEAIMSVLDRTPAAVTAIRAELISRRDAAAQNLDFERASRVQAEIHGFEWVVSEQNVTLSDPLDFEVCGWSHGILVHFGYRAGRLRSWTQRPCAQPDAQPYLAATPRQWLQFAERNALLAAQSTRSAIASEVAELAPAAGHGH